MCGGPEGQPNERAAVPGTDARTNTPLYIDKRLIGHNAHRETSLTWPLKLCNSHYLHS